MAEKRNLISKGLTAFLFTDEVFRLKELDKVIPSFEKRAKDPNRVQYKEWTEERLEKMRVEKKMLQEKLDRKVAALKPDLSLIKGIKDIPLATCIYTSSLLKTLREIAKEDIKKMYGDKVGDKLNGFLL